MEKWSENCTQKIVINVCLSKYMIVTNTSLETTFLESVFMCFLLVLWVTKKDCNNKILNK